LDYRKRYVTLNLQNLQYSIHSGFISSDALGIGYNTFLPLSRFISKHVIPDPHNVRLQLSVNGEIRQDDSTNLMIFKIPEILKSISEVMTLEKGDIVLSKFLPSSYKVSRMIADSM